MKFSRSLDDVVSSDGLVEVDQRSESEKFCGEAKHFQTIYQQLTKVAT
jgi:hypothetical protein